MATITAVRSGNWSDTSHVTGPWPGGSTPTMKPGVGDTVQTGAFIVTIDEDVHVALLNSTSSGYFAVTSAPTLPAVRAIIADVLNGGTAFGALRITNAEGLVTQTGNVTGGATSYAAGIFNTSEMGDVIGDVIGGTGIGASGIYMESGGTMGNVTGDVTGGAGESACGIYTDGGGVGDVIGDVTGGVGITAYGIYSKGGTIGDVIGDVTGGAGIIAHGIINDGGGAMGDVTGDVTGGSGDRAYGIYTQTGGVMGDVYGALVCGTNGLFPIFGPFKLVANPANVITVISSTDTPLTLSNDYPAEADVRDGVEYDRGTMTGEMAAGGNIGPVSIVIGGGGIRIS